MVRAKAAEFGISVDGKYAVQLKNPTMPNMTTLSVWTVTIYAI